MNSASYTRTGDTVSSPRRNTVIAGRSNRDSAAAAAAELGGAAWEGVARDDQNALVRENGGCIEASRVEQISHHLAVASKTSNRGLRCRLCALSIRMRQMDMLRTFVSGQPC